MKRRTLTYATMGTLTLGGLACALSGCSSASGGIAPVATTDQRSVLNTQPRSAASQQEIDKVANAKIVLEAATEAIRKTAEGRIVVDPTYLAHTAQADQDTLNKATEATNKLISEGTLKAVLSSNGVAGVEPIGTLEGEVRTRGNTDQTKFKWYGAEMKFGISRTQQLIGIVSAARIPSPSFLLIPGNQRIWWVESSLSFVGSIWMAVEARKNKGIVIEAYYNGWGYCRAQS